MPEVKEMPILFSAPMVRAILEGRKTVTRREIKPSKRGNDIGFELHQQDDGSWLPLHTFDESCMDSQGTEHPIQCPFGMPGDRLWVRETFIDLQGTGVEHRPEPSGPLQRYAYAADYSPGSFSDEARKDFGLKHKPSIHMPRSASRILLEVTDVSVERLQDISRAGIRAEGLKCPAELAGDDTSPNYRDWYPAAWRELWDSTGGDWEANPWVWVVEFKRVMP